MSASAVMGPPGHRLGSVVSTTRKPVVVKDGQMADSTTQPQLLAAAAADALEISSAISAAKAAAAGPTTSLAAAAEDEVSAITANLFGAGRPGIPGAPSVGGGIP